VLVPCALCVLVLLYTPLLPLTPTPHTPHHPNHPQADQKAGDINDTFLRECSNNLTRSFTTIAKDRGSKRLAIFAVTNALFKIYFKMNTLQLCSKLINVLEGPAGVMGDVHAFPVCDVVMYKYYLGRLKMFEDRYQEAR
jgi:hypothetical protein